MFRTRIDKREVKLPAEGEGGEQGDGIVFYDRDGPLFQFVFTSLGKFIVSTVIALTRDSQCAVKFRRK